jgi:NAD(P)-dependent dehydrogenase (short-subunit alcohol dehydrogenase family)
MVRLVKDKVIVITGASMGIGAALAIEVAKRGAKGVVLASRREADLAKVAAQVGPAAFAVQTDVTLRGDLERLRDKTLERFGQLDVLVNNAGRGITRLVADVTDDDIDDMISTNLKSVVYGIQAVLPHFKQHERGQIVTISSGLARFPFAGERSAYAASKAAVNLMMGCLRMELRAAYPDIHCTTVMPGVVATEFGNNALHGGYDSRKLPGAQPVEEVAQVIANAIEKPVAECYTRPQMRELAAMYFSAEDVGAIESRPPFFASPPAKP